MTDPIYNKPLRGPADPLQRAVVDKTDKKAPAASAQAQAAPDAAAAAARSARAPGPDELLLSNVAARAQAEPAYDKVKVESIKKAIQDGQYPLDPRRIAESFHALENMIRE
jgi:negative regulator of flagellin synthesis FlgM